MSLRNVFRRALCLLVAHQPALVVEPTRCRRCERMIRWERDGHGKPGAGWRLA